MGDLVKLFSRTRLAVDVRARHRSYDVYAVVPASEYWIIWFNSDRKTEHLFLKAERLGVAAVECFIAFA